ncbi:hypothetical protein [Actinorugispora endophytica]|uniref:Uncharacterized protein n=1 Tax=Actinorugispora endophytica TaxID=1605990 RepID=A0A4R6UT18_9ACTN|nr:hypothetical protein [Actinorugispora endophytica]TDQ50291.1 hypothetical protein EV190_11360 [Actinorugispora endophytica]
MGSRVVLIRDSGLTDAVDYAYAASVEAPVRAVWTAGACPLDADGNTVAVGDYASRARSGPLGDPDRGVGVLGLGRHGDVARCGCGGSARGPTGADGGALPRGGGAHELAEQGQHR